MHKIRQAGWFLSRFLGSLLKTGLFLIVNVLRPLVKNVLIPLGLIAAAAAAEAATHKKMFGSGARPSDLAKRTKLITSNEEINNTTKKLTNLKSLAYW